MDGTLRGEIQRRWEGDDQLEMTREERERSPGQAIRQQQQQHQSACGG